MATPVLLARIKNLILTEAEWLLEDFIPHDGETIYVRFYNTDGTSYVNIKVGDGLKPFSQLEYNLELPAKPEAGIKPGDIHGELSKPMFWFAEPGQYANFGNQEITGAAGVIVWNGSQFSSANFNIDLTGYAPKNETETKIALAKGVDLFTLQGYINGNNGSYIEQTGSTNRCTGFIPFTHGQTLSCTNLTALNLFNIRQAIFYSSDNEASFISSYNDDDQSNVSIISSNTPANTKFIRLNGEATNARVLTYDGIKSNSTIEVEITTSNDDRKNAVNIVSGVNLFTKEGYVHGETGIFSPQTGSNNRATDFIELIPGISLACTNLTVGGPVRQGSFYSERREDSFISSYTNDDNPNVNFEESNIPAGAKYVRLNGVNLLVQELSYNGIASSKYLQDKVITDQIIVDKIKNGEDIFTVTGYRKKTDGTLDTNPAYRSTDFIYIDRSKPFFAFNLAVVGGSAFTQAAFYKKRNATSFISAYDGPDRADIELNSYNIPRDADYVIFTKNASDPGTVSYSFKHYRSVAPLKCVSGAWNSIDPVSGYSLNYGRYWDGTNWFANQYFSGLVYAVIPGKTIKIRGNFYGNNMPIVAFFSNETLTTHVANGNMKGGAIPKPYFFEETVPAGASFVLVQQFRAMGTNQPFTEMVVESPDEEIKQKILLTGNSFVGMAGFAEELMTPVKQTAPQYDIYNYGIGGEKTNEILARSGASQIFVTPKESYLSVDGTTGQRYFILPATTATVEIGSDSLSNSWNSDKLALLKQTTATTDCAPDIVFIDGIECLLTRTDGPNGPDGQPTNVYHLNRVTAGSAIHKVFTGTQLIPKSSIAINDKDIVIINIDANGGWTDVDDLVAQNQRLIDSFGTNRYIVLSSHYAQNYDSSLTSYVANRILQETALRKAFGSRYINTREYFITHAVNDALDSGYWNTGNYPTDVPGEVHPNSTDIVKMNNGEFAPMFLPNPNNTGPGGDIIHLSRRSYLIYYKYIFNKIKALNYLK